MRESSFRLITLGRLALLMPGGSEEESLATRRRKLALLAVLALSRRPLSRDYLVELFWGGQDEARARHSLSDALSHLRRVLGRDALATNHADVALDPGARLVADAREFVEAIARREWDTALGIYGGPFLDCVHVGGSAAFERWVASERGRLEGAFVQACERRCSLLARANDWEECAAIARRWNDAAPLSAEAARTLLSALAAPDTREAKRRALAAYELVAARLRRDFDIAPEPAVTALARELARQLAAVEAPADLAPPPPPAPTPAQPAATREAGAAAGPPATPGPDRGSGLPQPVLAAALQLARALASASSHAASADGVAATSAKPSPQSVAVLPFANMSADTENEYFAEGMAEEVLNALSRIPGLRVASRTSSFAFKHRRQNIRAIGAQLNVGAVVEGSVRRAGSRLRVTAQLVNVADGYRLWSESFDREVHDIFAIQEELARTIVSALRPELVGRPGARVIKRYTDNVRAYDLYLRGRYHLNHITAGSLSAAMECFERAIAEDPLQAPAHAALASACVAYAFFGEGAFPPQDLWRRARAAATTALAIDAELADALGSLGTTKWACDWDFAGAEEALRHAVELKPGDALLHNWHGWALLLLGRANDCLLAHERARDLDPLSPWTHRSVVRALYLDRRYDSAAEECRKAIGRFPQYYLLPADLASIRIAQSRLEDSLPLLERAHALQPGDSRTLGLLAYAHARLGDRDKGVHFRAMLEAEAARRFVTPVDLAVAHLGLGDVDAAFAALEAAFDARDAWFPWVRCSPMVDELRADLRFARLLEAMR